MLVLSRKKNETIIITCPDGTRLEFIAVEMRGDKMRIGVEAPKDYTIHRGEVQARIDLFEAQERLEEERMATS